MNQTGQTTNGIGFKALMVGMTMLAVILGTIGLITSH